MSDDKVLRLHFVTACFFLIVVAITWVFFGVVLEEFKHRINHVESVVQELIDELAPRLREGALDHET